MRQPTIFWQTGEGVISRPGGECQPDRYVYYLTLDESALCRHGYLFYGSQDPVAKAPGWEIHSLSYLYVLDHEAKFKVTALL